MRPKTTSIHWICCLLLLLSPVSNAQSEFEDLVHTAFSSLRSMLGEPPSNLRTYPEESSFSRGREPSFSNGRQPSRHREPSFDPLSDTPISQPRQQNFGQQRDLTILGAQPRPPITAENNPLCRGQSRLCDFIHCQAENFKNDQSLANLNLAAQVLGDKKLRQAVGQNPEAVNAVCMDQGMDAEKCALFTKGFLFLNKLITNIEKPFDEMQAAMPPEQRYALQQQTNEALARIQERHFWRDVARAELDWGTQGGAGAGSDWSFDRNPRSPTGSWSSRTLVRAKRNVTEPDGDSGSGDILVSRESSSQQEDDFFPTASSGFQLLTGESDAKSLGSKTWSAVRNSILPQNDERNDWLASLTPPPLLTPPTWPTLPNAWTFETPTPFSFSAPTPPTAPPLAFPTVPSFVTNQISPLDALLQPATEPQPLNAFKLKIEPILRVKRETSSAESVEYFVDVGDSFRMKRQGNSNRGRISHSNARRGSASAERSRNDRREPVGGEKEPDYYDTVDPERAKKRPQPKRNCFALLG